MLPLSSLLSVSVLLSIVAVQTAVSCSSSSSCCCGEGKTVFEADLTSGKSTISPGSGMSWARPLYDRNSRTGCDMQGVLKIVFPQTSNNIQKRRLQFDLYFASKRKGWNFDISDSTNNGYGGDAGHSSNSAEVHNVGENFLVFTNTLPGYKDYSTNGHLTVKTYAKALSNHVTITVGDEYVKFDNNRGMQNEFRSKYLYTLSGQPTTYGSVDYVIYFSMNRVVYPFRYASRTGTGLCRATIKALDC